MRKYQNCLINFTVHHKKNFYVAQVFLLILAIFWPLNANLFLVFFHHVRFSRYNDTSYDIILICVVETLQKLLISSVEV